MDPTRSPSWTLQPQGDHSLVIELGDTLGLDLSRRCAALAAALRKAHMPGVLDIVSAFTTVTLHLETTRGAPALSEAELEAHVSQALAGATPSGPMAKTVEIPVCYGGEFGPDLEEVARLSGLTVDEVIDAHTASSVWVLMLGFAPGSPYLGVHDERFDLPRRTTPRTRVPKGSVAIAARQSIVYPQESPGGWHVIGRTPTVLFDPLRSPPSLLVPGDAVRFVSISAQAFSEQAGESP